MRKLLLFNLLIGLLAGTPAHADNVMDKLQKLHKPIVARTTEGVIRSINLEKRTAIIGGFLYEFGPTYFPLKVTMLNDSPGSIEMLKVGMKVEVMYGELGTARLASSIKQLPEDTQVEN